VSGDAPGLQNQCGVRKGPRWVRFPFASAIFYSIKIYLIPIDYLAPNNYLAPGEYTRGSARHAIAAG
jgi:hypothetical protein